MVALIRRQREAELELRSYVLGLVTGLGIPLERVAGIDDVTGELLLRPPDEPED